ncbi:MAG: hypothetical protein V3S97_11100, partial [Candidatus Bathyarchaeia archaeon]
SLCSLFLAELGSTVVRTRWPTGAGVLVDRFSLIVRLYFQQCQLPRHNGPPGVSIGYFQRTIVRYTGFGHMTDRGLWAASKIKWYISFFIVPNISQKIPEFLVQVHENG